MYRHLSRTLFLAMLTMSLSTAVVAQEDPGPPPVDPEGGGPPTDPDAEIPFDGGLSLLLTAGAAYGAKKAVDYRNFVKLSKDDGQG